MAFSSGIAIAQGSDEARDAKLHEAFSQFPLLTPDDDRDGIPDFQTVSLTNSVVVDGERYGGFRFTVPKREHNEDLIWIFVGDNQFYEWTLLPQSGQFVEDEGFIKIPKSACMRTNQLVPGHELLLTAKTYPGETLRDGETYLAWWHFTDNRKEESFAFAFHSMAPSERTNEHAIRTVFGLERPSDPVISPINHHTYVLLRSSTWKDAEARAVAMGGHLATVRNQAEEDWLLQTFGHLGGEQRLLWVGLSDRDKKFHFTWSSGESVSYTAWAKGEPNNAGRGEDFVAIYYPNHNQHGKWNDWGDRKLDPIGLPLNGVVEIIPPEPAQTLPAQEATSTLQTAPTAPVAGSTTPPTNLTAGTSGRDLSVTITPNLVITNDSGSIQLQWPVEFSSYMLEATGDLTQPFTMFGYSELTNDKLGVVYVTITNPVPQMFFRLRKP